MATKILQNENQSSTPTKNSCTTDVSANDKSPGSPIGEDACPICLGQISEKAAAGSCLHNFCLICLKEWAKQKPVCPLCKQSFNKILYNITSETDFKEWIVPPRSINSQDGVSIEDYFGGRESRRFFGYRTTNFPGAIRLRQLSSQFLNRPTTDAIPSGLRPERSTLSRFLRRGSSRFRLSVYQNNIWAESVSDITGRFRESSPELYCLQPALTHRLVPWVNRELAALVSPSRISVLLTDIMSLIERYPIESRDFRHALRPSLGSYTRHFIHEFSCFARSPYDMVGHDNVVQYIPFHDQYNEDSDDDVIEVSSDGIPLSSISSLELSQDSRTMQPAAVAREEILTNDGSVIISSDGSAESDIEGNSRNILFSAISNRFRQIRRDITSDIDASSNNLDSEELLAMPGPSGINVNVRSDGIIKEENSESDSTGECTVLDMKAKKERRPEIIDLISESETDVTLHTRSAKRHWKKKMIDEPESNKKRHKKPKLDRTSFSLHFSSRIKLNLERDEVTASGRDTSARNQPNKDHTYYTESSMSIKPLSSGIAEHSRKRTTKKTKKSSSEVSLQASQSNSSTSYLKYKSRQETKFPTCKGSYKDQNKHSPNDGKKQFFPSKKHGEKSSSMSMHSHKSFKIKSKARPSSKPKENHRHLRKWVCKKKKLYYYSKSDSDSDTSTTSATSSAIFSSSDCSSSSSSCTSNSSNNCSSSSTSSRSDSSISSGSPKNSRTAKRRKTNQSSSSLSDIHSVAESKNRKKCSFTKKGAHKTNIKEYK